MPEEVVAQDHQLKLYYAGKSSEGVRMKAGPKALAELPSMLVGLAKSRDRGRRAAADRVQPGDARRSSRPSEAMQWLNAHHVHSPITRHALVVLESIDAVDLAFDTFVCALLDGEVDTSGYPEYNAIVGGVAVALGRGDRRHDLPGRRRLGRQGRPRRHRPDRRQAPGRHPHQHPGQPVRAWASTAIERPVPAAGRGGLVCAHCGFASAHERAFYCPKCGMRLLRG